MDLLKGNFGPMAAQTGHIIPIIVILVISIAIIIVLGVMLYKSRQKIKELLAKKDGESAQSLTKST